VQRKLLALAAPFFYYITFSCLLCHALRTCLQACARADLIGLYAAQPCTVFSISVPGMQLSERIPASYELMQREWLRSNRD